MQKLYSQLSATESKLETLFQYQRIVFALKKSVFPFAYHYDLRKISDSTSRKTIFLYVRQLKEELIYSKDFHPLGNDTTDASLASDSITTGPLYT